MGLLDRLDRVDRAHAIALAGGMRRRAFLAWCGSLGLAASGGALLSAARTAWAEEPRRGGRLVLCQYTSSEDDTLDPPLFTTMLDYIRGRMFYGSLVRIQEDLSWTPELAEEVLSNDDASEWTFKLRRGVEFHNGKTLDADDVIYTLHAHLGEDSRSKVNVLLRAVEAVDRVSEHEVRVRLGAPNVDFPLVFSTFQMKIFPDGHTDFSNAVGTGPYRMAEFTPGGGARGTRFENYWDIGNGAWLDELVSTAIVDPEERMAAFLDGRIDVMESLPIRHVRRVKRRDDLALWAVPSGQYICIASMLDRAPSSNMELIRAMQYLVPRQALVDGALGGFGTVGNDHPISPAYGAAHCEDLPQRVPDHDRARHHFKRSGVGRTPVDIMACAVSQGAVEQCLSLQRDAAVIGLNLRVRLVTTAGYWSKVWMQVPFSVVRWNMRPTAHIMLMTVYHSAAPWNETRFVSPRLDTLLDAIPSTVDTAQRLEMFCEAQRLIHEGSGTILPAHGHYIDAVAAHVGGLTYVPTGTFGGAECPPSLWDRRA